MSLQMSTRGRYGVRLMVALAVNHGNGSSLLRDIARQEGISEKYLGQIVIPLKASGLLSAHRGAHGGYSLARPPEAITVRDVVEAIEGTIAPVPCVDPSASAGPGECGDDPTGCDRATTCVATRVWKRLRDDIVATLSSFTLAELARQAREIGPAADNYVI
ncbi:MAG TPA: Rrf2 family transcriptional regulator [Spirochaetia bacterium]|nr:Rrf2 family transcriptional regulator [Spirochaetia bacterium]